MSEEIRIYEGGIRLESGTYVQILRSEDRVKVEEDIDLIKDINPDWEVVFLEKCYHLVSTTPRIIYAKPTPLPDSSIDVGAALDKILNLSIAIKKQARANTPPT